MGFIGRTWGGPSGPLPFWFEISGALLAFAFVPALMAWIGPRSERHARCYGTFSSTGGATWCVWRRFGSEIQAPLLWRDLAVPRLPVSLRVHLGLRMAHTHRRGGFHTSRLGNRRGVSARSDVSDDAYAEGLVSGLVADCLREQEVARWGFSFCEGQRAAAELARLAASRSPAPSVSAEANLQRARSMVRELASRLAALASRSPSRESSDVHLSPLGDMKGDADEVLEWDPCGAPLVAGGAAVCDAGAPSRPLVLDIFSCDDDASAASGMIHFLDGAESGAKVRNPKFLTFQCTWRKKGSWSRRRSSCIRCRALVPRRSRGRC